MREEVVVAVVASEVVAIAGLIVLADLRPRLVDAAEVVVAQVLAFRLDLDVPVSVLDEDGEPLVHEVPADIVVIPDGARFVQRQRYVTAAGRRALSAQYRSQHVEFHDISEGGEARCRRNRAFPSPARNIRRMRIISGKWRGRKIAWPAHGGTRPLPDALRETLFNILGSIYAAPGELPPLHVADVFAGSGSIGIEALSRGAASCVFFENDRRALAVLRKNLDTLQVGSEAALVATDAWRARLTREDGVAFDLVFLDPPYADARDTSPTGPVPRLLERLALTAAASARVVLHHEREIAYPPRHGSGWRCEDRRRIGSHAITLFCR